MASLGLQQLSDMVTQVGNALGDTSTGTQAQIKDMLNRALDHAASLYDWPQLRQHDESGLRNFGDSNLKTLESAEAHAPLPIDTTWVRAIVHQDIDQGQLEQRSPEDLYHLFGSRKDNQGVPELFAVVGHTAQYAAIGTAGAVTISSNQTNANAVVRVHYRKSGRFIGQSNWEDLTTADWTAGVATNATLATGWEVEKISLPSTWVGSCTAVDNGAKSIIGIQAIEEPPATSNSTYQIISMPLIRVFPVPSKDYACTVIWTRQPLRMTEDEDLPEVPVSEYLVAKAAAYMLEACNRLGEAQQQHVVAGQLLQSKFHQNHTGQKSKSMRVRRGNVLGMTGVRCRY